MRVREVMSGAVLSVTPETPVAETRRLMQRERIRHVLVLDGGRLAGIVSDRDIRLTLPSPATTLSVWEMNDLLMKLTAAEIMTSPVTTIAPDREVHEAAQLMIDHKIGALPVLEGGRLVGIVTETDLLRALVLLRARALPVGTARA
jgi:acetoin utilization protein AcuB